MGLFVRAAAPRVAPADKDTVHACVGRCRDREVCGKQCCRCGRDRRKFHPVGKWNKPFTEGGGWRGGGRVVIAGCYQGSWLIGARNILCQRCFESQMLVTLALSQPLS